MVTINQIVKGHRRAKYYKDHRIAITKCPQKKGTCIKVYIMTPRKPNSALRKITRVVLHHTWHRIFAYIPGIGHRLQKHSNVLIRGGRVKDLPGVKYTIIRGKFDLMFLINRRAGRSKYGTKKVYNRHDHRYFKYRYW